MKRKFSLTEITQSGAARGGRARKARHGRPARVGGRAAVAVPGQRGRPHLGHRRRHPALVELPPENPAGRPRDQVPEGEVTTFSILNFHPKKSLSPPLTAHPPCILHPIREAKRRHQSTCSLSPLGDADQHLLDSIKRKKINVFFFILKDNLHALAFTIEMVVRGHGARERPRDQHRELRSVRLPNQLEQSNRTVSDITTTSY